MTCTLTLAAAVALAAPALAGDETTVGTPDAGPVGAAVTVEHPIVIVPEDPQNGGSGSVELRGVRLDTRGIDDPTAPAEPDQGEGQGKDKKEKKEKDKP